MLNMQAKRNWRYSLVLQSYAIHSAMASVLEATARKYSKWYSLAYGRSVEQFLRRGAMRDNWREEAEHLTFLSWLPTVIPVLQNLAPKLEAWCDAVNFLVGANLPICIDPLDVGVALSRLYPLCQILPNFTPRTLHAPQRQMILWLLLKCAASSVV